MVGGGGERGGAHAPGTFTQFYELDLGWFSARNILFCSIITPALPGTRRLQYLVPPPLLLGTTAEVPCALQ